MTEEKIRDPVVRMRGQVTDQPPVALLRQEGDAQRHLFFAARVDAAQAEPGFLLFLRPVPECRLRAVGVEVDLQGPAVGGFDQRAQLGGRHVRPQFQAFGQRQAFIQVIHPLRVQFQQDAVEQFLALQAAMARRPLQQRIPGFQPRAFQPAGQGLHVREGALVVAGLPFVLGMGLPEMADGAVQQLRQCARGGGAGAATMRASASSRISTQRLMSCGWLIR